MFPEFNTEKAFLQRVTGDTHDLLEDQIRRQFLFLANELKELVPVGPEQVLMYRKLQEAMAWGITALRSTDEIT